MFIKKSLGSILSILMLCTVFIPKVMISADDTVIKSEDITIELSNYDFKIGSSFTAGTASISYSSNVSNEWIKTNTGTVAYGFETSAVVVPDKEYVTNISFDMNIPEENMGIAEGDSINVNSKGWKVDAITKNQDGSMSISVTDTYKIDGSNLFDIVLPDFDDIYYLENGNTSSKRRTVKITPKYDIYGVRNVQNNTNCYGNYDNTIIKQNINLTKGTEYNLDINTNYAKVGTQISFHGRWYIGNDEYTLFNVDFETKMIGPNIYIKDGSSLVESLPYVYKGQSIEHENFNQYRIRETIKNCGNYTASNVRLEFSEYNRGYFTVEGLDSVTLQPGDDITFDIVVNKDLPVGVYEDSFTIKFDGIFEGQIYQDTTKTSWVSLELYKYYPVEISLLEKLNGEELPGGVFKVRSNYEIIDTFTTTSEPKQLIFRNNTYFTLIQDKAPDGYALRNKEYNYRMNDDGTVRAELRNPTNDLGSVYTDLGDNKIMIFNDKQSDKYDVTFFATNTRSNTSTFHYLEDVDIELKNYVTEETVDKWTSADEGHIVKSLPVGTYEISAKYPALNYDRTYRFELKNDGSMTHLLRQDPSVAEILYTEYGSNDKLNLAQYGNGKSYTSKPYARINNRFFYLHILESIETNDERTLVRVIDGNTQQPIEGVSLKMINRYTKLVEDSWITTSDPHLITIPNDRKGRDVVVEIPEGYYGNESYYVPWTRELFQNEPDYVILIRLFKNEDTAIRVNVSCLGEINSNFKNREIPGAILELYDYQDNLIERWESTDEPHAIYLRPDIGINSDNYPRYDYYIKEVQFPENCEPIYYIWPFTLSANGDLKGSNARDYESGEVLEIGKLSKMTETYANNIAIRHGVMYEELDLFKKDAVTEEFLSGGEFEVRFGSTGEGRLYGEYTASKEGIKIKVPINSVFTIIEKKAPDNYDGEAKITMRFDSTGKLAVIHNDGYWRYYENEETVVLENNRVSQDVLINKVDEKGNYVEDVKISIYAEDGSLVHELITGREAISINLPVGKYVLKEITTPEGYVSVEEFTFEITEDGKIKSEKDVENISVDELTITVINKRKPDIPETPVRKYRIPKTGD